MNKLKILVIGGGIGGLTSAIALRQKGFGVDVIEKDPDWSVYGVGIIQQSNVIRAVATLGILDDYLGGGFGFDEVKVHKPDGTLAASVPSPTLEKGYPAILGISRPALHKVLGENATKAGAIVRLGVTATNMANTENGVTVTFSDESAGSYDVVVGADGLYSDIRRRIFPDAKDPEFTGQSGWRYNLTRPADVTCLEVYEGASGMGLMPLSNDIMYIFVTTAEPGNPRYPRKGLAAKMRARLADACPRIREFAALITEDDAVVYKPLDWHMLTGDWHRGRVVLLGDAAHGTTPHLGQGAGMAIEDSVVLADELSKRDTPERAFRAYRERRFQRCKFIVDLSTSLCFGQLGRGPGVSQAEATRAMFEVTSQPI